MLAYLFWHRPRPGVEQEEYEQAQRQFHALLEVESACFWVEQLPFGDGAGYEDWYLVEDWQGLGELNAAAIDAKSTADFLAGFDSDTPIWQRQMVLGPAPEFCIGDGPPRRSVVPLSSIS